MQSIIGMMAAREIWERAMIPSVLSGACTWFGLKGNMKKIYLCEDLHNHFWRVLLAVTESCRKIDIRCETGMMVMKWRIWTAKIILLMRIKKQEKGSLSHKVYYESRAKGWPGLGEEVSHICEEIGLPDVNEKYVTKQALGDAIWNHHYDDLKMEISNYKKLNDIKDEDISNIQEYLKDSSVENTRMTFEIRSHMVTEIPCKFKNKYKIKKKGNYGLICAYCTEIKKWIRVTA